VQRHKTAGELSQLLPKLIVCHCIAVASLRALLASIYTALYVVYCIAALLASIYTTLYVVYCIAALLASIYIIYVAYCIVALLASSLGAFIGHCEANRCTCRYNTSNCITRVYLVQGLHAAGFCVLAWASNHLANISPIKVPMPKL
jgi:hypothetical protein